MMRPIDLYKDALFIDKSCKEQRKIFSYWSSLSKFEEHQCLGFDTETTGVTFGVPSNLFLPPSTVIKCTNVTVFGISMAIPYKDKIALFWGRLGSQLFEECTELLKTPGPKVGHNSRFDLRACRANDITVNGKVHCTLTMGRIYWDRRMKFDLQSLSEEVCPEVSDWEVEVKSTMRNIKSSHTRAGYPKGYTNYSFIPDEIIGKYSMTDSFLAYLLFVLLYPPIMENFRVAYNREIKVIPIVMDMESRGMQYDRVRSKRETYKLEKRMTDLTEQLIKVAKKPFNPFSPKQVLEMLLHIGVKPKLLMKEGKLTTEKEKLESAVVKIKKKRVKDFVTTLLDLRSQQKIVNTYLKPLYYKASFNRGVVYCNLNPTDTRTSRMSSNDPNLHNIPRPTSGYHKYNPVRKCFICRSGYNLYFPDYSQMEMWMFAIHARETTMLKHLSGGKDIHEQTAVDIVGDEAFDDDGKVKKEKRQFFKSVNFAIIYGMGFRALATWLKVSQIEAHDVRMNYFYTYPNVLKFMERNKELLVTQGYVKGIFGRRYYIPIRKAYVAANCLVQGDCAQILKIGLINLCSYLEQADFPGELKPHILMCIHDETIIEIPKTLRKHPELERFHMRAISDCMTDIMPLLRMGYRLKVDIKRSEKSWEDKEKFQWLPRMKKTRQKKIRCQRTAKTVLTL